ncbi:MAG: hypothetical protein ACJAYV_000596 [Oleispira sp.]|jgi:hypothetical protein
MDRVPLINPRLVNAVAAQAERTPAPILRAEVLSSEAIKATPEQHESPRQKTRLDQQTRLNQQTPQGNRELNNRDGSSEKSAVEEQRYSVMLKIGKQQFKTISTENFKKGSQLDVKVMPGPELKIITNPNDQSQISSQIQTKSLAQTPAQLAMQQLLADRIPNVKAQGLAKLIDQLSLLMPHTDPATKAATSSAINTKVENLLIKSQLIDSSSPSKVDTNTQNVLIQSPPTQTTKQALANLAYQSLANQTLIKNHALNSKVASAEITTPSMSSPVQQVKDWLQQLPNAGDISTSTGLRNALNNTGVRAETQLSQLAQQFAALNKAPQSSATEKNANSIFQQLQRIQQKVFSKSSEPLSKIDLNAVVKNTAQNLEKSSQAIPVDLKATSKNTKIDNSPTLIASLVKAELNQKNISLTNPTSISNPLSQAVNNWQNPLLNNQTYSTLSELLKDPLLQKPSSNNKFALSQILNNSADSAMRIPLNWPERSGNEAVFLRTLQNLLGHIEREQGIQSQQSDNNTANNTNLTTPQNQQWLPLLIHQHQQLQLIEFFINKEEKANSQGEKKNHWFINLHFDLPKLGKLGIEISMFENECNTTFWSESSSTLNQLSYHVQPLRERLTEQGIIVSDVQSRHGTLSKRKQTIEQRLIDIET